MAAPARKPSSGTEHTDEALEILRRLEPVLARLDETQRKQGETLARQGEDIADIKGVLKDQHRDIAKLQQDAARLDGRVSLLPTLWQLAALIFAIFGASFVLMRFAPPH